MDETIENGVGDRGVVEPAVPVIDGELAGDDGGAATDAIVDDFQQVVAGALVQWCQSPVIQNQQVDTGQLR